jgi:hypothetical protein
MPDFCSCGSQLVPDSLFCHKCGKPTRDLPEVETQPVPVFAEFAPAVTPPPPDPKLLPPNFHNPVAVRVAFLVALLATLMSWVPLLNIVLWVAAGFAAVFLYRRRTGAMLSVRAGASLGWITGVMMFVFSTVIFTVTLLPTAASGGVANMFRAQLKNPSDPNVQEALRMLETPGGLAAILLATLFMLFVLITALSMAGGALGAKLASRGEGPAATP